MADILLFTDALVISCLLTLLTTGLTLTYLTTKVPNFAHGSFATAGIYVGLVTTKLLGLNIYLGLIPGFLLGGLVAVIQYIAILRPMIKRNSSITALMVATIAFDILLISILNILADYLQNIFQIASRYFLLSNFDFTILGIRGIIIVAPLLVVASVVGLYLLLSRTKFGIAMRATIENPSLAGTMGINIDLVYIISWFIAGGLAGLAGSVIPLWYIGNPDVGSAFFLTSFFAAAVVGGLYNIYGAVIGGFVVGVTESVVIRLLAGAVGSWITPYQPLIPLIAMVIALLVAPKGITGANLQELKQKIRGIKHAQ
jgi:Branched-chain amino acid ABC-type transport system, permease components